MKGYFISFNADIENPLAFVYELEYDIDTANGPYATSGTWSPSVLENHEDFVILKCAPGHHLRIVKPKNNPYFKRFCKSVECSCNGWMEGKTYSPYKVSRFKHDRMFMLLAEDSSTAPVDVQDLTLHRVLAGCKVIRK